MNRNSNTPAETQEHPIFGFYKDPVTGNVYKGVIVGGDFEGDIEPCCSDSGIGSRIRTNVMPSGSFQQTHAH